MNIKKVLNSKNIALLFFVVWVIFSIGYISYDQYKKIKIKLINSAYIQAENNILQNIIDSSQQCKPVTIVDKDKKQINLISLECLQQQTNNQNDEQIINNKNNNN